MISIDKRELEKLAAQLEAFAQVDIGALCEEAVSKLGLLLLGKTVKRTPVGVYRSSGKVGGTLRRGWQIGTVVKKGDAYEIEIFNNTQYAAYVEYGHRNRGHTGWVMGRFMMSISKNEVERQSQAVIRKIVQRHLEEAFRT